MKSDIRILAALSVLALASCKSEKSEVSAIDVEFEGANTQYLVLEYSDTLGEPVSDTIRIENNRFSINNPVNKPQNVWLSSNLTGPYIEDPNRLAFFLEPGEIKLNLKEGHFPDAEITGSATQEEKENLERLVQPLRDKADSLYNLNQELLKSQQMNPVEDLQEQLAAHSQEQMRLGEEITAVELDYAGKNPDSYLSASLINRVRTALPKDSLQAFYAGFSPEIKESVYGKNIKALLELQIVDTGDPAPNFSGTDFNGKDLSLAQFRGKTVLLDFTAAWCVPCIENHPKLKSLYKDFHSRGLEAISISLDKDEESWKENVLREKLGWHQLYEGLDNLRDEGTITKMYHIQPIPAYILIDENGIIVNRYAGANNHIKTLEDLEKDLNRIFSKEKAIASTGNAVQ